MNEIVQTLVSRPVRIPSERLDMRLCTSFADSVIADGSLRIINFIDSLDCQSCKMQRFVRYEKLYGTSKKFSDVEFMYIVNTTVESEEFLYETFCNSRVGGIVFFDTCHAFLQANPHIPDDPLFHTFVLNEQDSVVLVGDPFKNEKMEQLFLKVIEREKQRKANENHL
ncbi:MAG: hypothetical protein PUC18_03100 [Prevotellaceae bacterium]|nr:hypothetical protein [Prevotellaceae bacterium]